MFQRGTLLLMLWWSAICPADNYHYKDILIGERASGMGGAFCAISDDPSGIYHNPAGIVFGLENYLSVTANAYNYSQQKYKNLYPNQDYTYLSAALVPVLFGFTQSVRKKKFGFAVIVPNSDLIDQNDTVTKDADTTGPARSFSRKFFRQDTTYLMGPAFAMEVRENLSVGISVFAFMHNVKIIDNTLVLYAPDGTGKYFVYQANGTRLSYGLMPKAGIQFMPSPKVSLGLTIARAINTGGSGRMQITNSKLAGGEPTSPTGIFNNDMETLEGAASYEEATPLSISLGTTYFASRRFLLTGQADYHSAYGNDVKQTVNLSLGTEFYLNEAVVLRGGIYTNNANTSPIGASDINMAPHVNMLGFTIGSGLYRSGTSLTVSLGYVTGMGYGQAFADTAQKHEVYQSSIAFYLGGGYQL